MSNHTHVVLCVDVEKAEAWTDVEVVEHWHTLLNVERYKKKQS
jgi:hypothetical protein